MSELKHHLRKQEFPVSAREALLRLEKLCHSPQQQRLLQEVMEEFIFCETDRRGIKKKRLNAIQELQLQDVLTIYFETQESEVVRNTVFLTLFHYDGNTANNKMKILSKIVSTAIATRCCAVLNCSAVWMQQGCTSDVVINLAQELVGDFLVLFPSAVVYLQELPQISMPFTAHFMTAVTAMYNQSAKRSANYLPPPQPLLRCITRWVASDPGLCTIPLVAGLQNCLPKGSIVMMPGVAILGLVQWCLEDPLYAAGTKGSSGDRHAGDPLERQTLYSQLHLAVIETLIETEKIRDRIVQKDMLPMRDFLATCDTILNRILGLDFVRHHDRIQLTLDRLGQVVQVALMTGCLRGNMDELWSYLVRFPQNRLIRIVVQQTKNLM